MSGFVLAFAVGGVAVARAETAASEWRIEASAPPGCGDRFAEELRARASVGLSPTAERVLRVRVARRGSSFTGTLDVEDVDASTHREIEAASCEEAVSSLAFIAALAIDPRRAASPGTDGGEGEAEASAEPPPVDSRPRAIEEKPARVPENKPKRARLRGGASVEASTLGEAALVSVGGLVSVESRSTGAVSPWGRLRIMASLPMSAESRSGSASLFWGTASIEGSPIRIELSESATLRPSVGVDAGFLNVRGSGGTATETLSRSRPWVAPRAALRLSLVPARRLMVDLAAGVLVPLSRESFVFEPNEQVFRAPPVTAFSELAVGVHFL